MMNNHLTVSPKEISNKLIEVRKSVEESDNKAISQAKVTLANLIILSISNSDARQSHYIDSLISELVFSHPSRFFLVNYLPQTKTAQSDRYLDYITTAVSSRCLLANNGSHVCSEEVFINAETKGSRVVPNLLLSLLVPDVEAVLIILSDPRDLEVRKDPHNLHFKSLLSGIQGLSDLIVYDSALFESYGESVKAIFDFRKSLNASSSLDYGSSLGSASCLGEEYPKVRDMNWGRTLHWRRLIAEQFEGLLIRDLSEQVSAISFECKVSKESINEGIIPAEALLLASWIIDVLELKIKDATIEDEAIFVYCSNKSGENIVISFVFSKTIGGAPQSGLRGEVISKIRSITLSVNESGDILVFGFLKVPGDELAQVSKKVISSNNVGSIREEYSRKVPFRPKTLEELILAGVTTTESDASFESVFYISKQIANIVKVK